MTETMTDFFSMLQVRPVSPFETGGSRSVSLGQPLSLTAGGAGAAAPGGVVAVGQVLPAGLPAALPPPGDSGPLAGVSVPITVMRPRPLCQGGQLGQPLQHRYVDGEDGEEPREE